LSLNIIITPLAGSHRQAFFTDANMEAKKRGRGRPQFGAEPVKTTTITLDPELLRWLDSMKPSRGQIISGLIRKSASFKAWQQQVAEQAANKTKEKK
jgi:hypothetical protein